MGAAFGYYMGDAQSVGDGFERRGRILRTLDAVPIVSSRWIDIETQGMGRRHG